MGGRGEGGRGREGQERGEGRREGEKRGKRESGEGTGEEGRGEAASAFRICQPGLAPGQVRPQGAQSSPAKGKSGAETGLLPWDRLPTGRSHREEITKARHPPVASGPKGGRNDR